MPRYGVHSPRFFTLLSRVREAAPPEEWYQKAVEEVRETEMSFAERIKMRLNGYIYIGQRTMPGWKKALPFYRFRCPVHGLVESYPHGYNQRLECPLCLEASLEEARSRRDSMSRNEIEWDKTRDALAKLMKENYDKTRNLDLINTWYQARVLGDRLQEKQRETQFLLNCESAILRDCRQQLGDYMKKIEAKNEVVVHGGRFEDIEDEKLRNILLGPHTKKPEGET